MLANSHYSQSHETEADDFALSIGGTFKRVLQQVLRQDGPLQPPAAAQVGLAVLAALSAAHRAGVLHRDDDGCVYQDHPRVRLSRSFPEIAPFHEPAMRRIDSWRAFLPPCTFFAVSFPLL